MSFEKFCIGLDFGTDSLRAIVVNAKTGEQIASAIHHYPRWRDGLFCDAEKNRFRQHPLDHLEALEESIRHAIWKAGGSAAKNIVAISVASTGSSPVMVDTTGTPLSLFPGFEDDPDAMIFLWKDHTAIKEAAEINEQEKKFPTNYLKYCGGIYSSEWYWSKLLHIIRTNERVRKSGASFVEHCDWIPFLLTGGNDIRQMKRSVCAAGHKALWSEEWNGFPPQNFFASLDPRLKTFSASLPDKTFTADHSAGRLSKQWAEKLGLSENVIVGIGAIDAHMGAVGGQIEPYFLSKVMGTSTCDMLVAPVNEMEGRFVRGICGLVNGSVIPGMIGMEAGQSAFGDVFAWFKNLLSWPLEHLLTDTIIRNRITEKIIPELSRQAALLPPDNHSELSLDWFNGRRTPDANPLLKAAITNLSLSTDAPKIFHSLVESTGFGARAIAESFVEQGIPVKGLIGIGGIPRKSPFIMQTLADIMGMPIRINRSEQTGALGAAMFAATVARQYEKVEDAMDAMGQGFDLEYQPDRSRSAFYGERYKKYKQTGQFIEQE